jgi:FMN-dependent oxidoreductase (nitrilotriacetate monooxygenase family)
MHHGGSWRHPESDVDEVLDPVRYERLATIYERGLFDAVFIVDYQAVLDAEEGGRSVLLETGGQMAMLEPLQTLAVMGRVTKHLGLAATLSTTFNHAYQIARQFATLDHFSKGRASWNIVTSAQPAEARCLGLDQLPDKELRYDQADEVVEACIQLWESWEADALEIDRKRGIFADPAKVHYVTYAGKKVRTSGAFTTPRSPQGRPVLMQAGGSPRGREFAARWAEIIFTTLPDKPALKGFYDDIKSRMAAYGRVPETCSILPSIAVIVGDTESAAQEEADFLDSFATPKMGLEAIGRNYGLDLSRYPLDTPVAALPIDRSTALSAGAYENLMAMRKDGRGLTISDAALLRATTWMSPRYVGTVNQVVDILQDLFESRCCDGFILAQPLSPGGLIQFVEKVVPELQRRGLYRTKYSGRTFRENLASAQGSRPTGRSNQSRGTGQRGRSVS